MFIAAKSTFMEIPWTLPLENLLMSQITINYQGCADDNDH